MGAEPAPGPFSPLFQSAAPRDTFCVPDSRWGCHPWSCSWVFHVNGTAVSQRDQHWFEGVVEAPRREGGCRGMGRVYVGQDALPYSGAVSSFLGLTILWFSLAFLSRTSRALGHWFPYTCRTLSAEPWRARQPFTTFLKVASEIQSSMHTPHLCTYCSQGVGSPP